MKRHAVLWVILIVFGSPDFAFAADPISDAMCFDEQTFRGCYSASKEQCLEWADLAVNKCLERLPPRPPPPASIEQLPRSEFGEWNLALGHCSEIEFHKANLDRFKEDESCSSLLTSRQLGHAAGPLARPMRSSTHRRGPSGGGVAMMIGVPLLAGVLATFFYLQRLARVRRPSWLMGFLSWLLFLASSFGGELLSHRLFPQLYTGLGDNPSQVGGLMLAWFASIPLTAAFWIWHRRKGAG